MIISYPPLIFQVYNAYYFASPICVVVTLNTLRTGGADLRFYITTVQDG